MPNKTPIYLSYDYPKKLRRLRWVYKDITPFSKLCWIGTDKQNDWRRRRSQMGIANEIIREYHKQEFSRDKLIKFLRQTRHHGSKETLQFIRDLSSAMLIELEVYLEAQLDEA